MVGVSWSLGETVHQKLDKESKAQTYIASNMSQDTHALGKSENWQAQATDI